VRSGGLVQTVVVFQGGLGAQILSAAAYFSLKSDGHPVVADFSYFLKEPRVARAGGRGGRRGVSIWPWELEAFGLRKTDFEVAVKGPSLPVVLSDDTPEKINIAAKALLNSEIAERFSIGGDWERRILAKFGLETFGHSRVTGYVAVHIRRGDYLNVASWLVSDEEMLSVVLSRAICRKKLVLSSDSRVPSRTIRALKRSFDSVQVVNPEQASALETLVLLARSSEFFASNSQFSLVSALLGQGTAHIPEKFLRPEIFKNLPSRFRSF